jgi:hypothetical protein
MSEIVVQGDGMTTVAPGVRVGIFDICGHDFRDGRGEQPAALLVFDHPDATGREEWLRAGSEVHAGGHRWRVSAVTGTGRLAGSVRLTPI